MENIKAQTELGSIEVIDDNFRVVRQNRNETLPIKKIKWINFNLADKETGGLLELYFRGNELNTRFNFQASQNREMLDVYSYISTYLYSLDLSITKTSRIIVNIAWAIGSIYLIFISSAFLLMSFIYIIGLLILNRFIIKPKSYYIALAQKANYYSEQIEIIDKKIEASIEYDEIFDDSIDEEKRLAIHEFNDIVSSLHKIAIKNELPQLKPLTNKELDEMPNIPSARIPKDEGVIPNFCDFVSIDVETTGLSQKKHKIIEVCAVRFIDYRPHEYFHSFINPQMNIPYAATDINGITNEMVIDAPKFSDIGHQLSEFIGNEKIIVAHNIEFDIKFLYANGINFFNCKRKYIDTLALARTSLKKYKDTNDDDYEYDVYNYKLETLLNYFDIFIPKSHSALNDAIATGILFSRLLYYRTH